MRRNEKKYLTAPAMLAGATVLLVLFVVRSKAGGDPLERTIGEAPVAIENSAATVREPLTHLLGHETSQPVASQPAVSPSATQAPVPASTAVLDERRQFALGAIETANNDRAIGKAGEVSRYQIMPSVWKRYSGSSYYRNPEIARAVAQQHWSSLYNSFKKQAHREPNDFDMYVLWNTRYGYYASKGFNPARLHPVVRDSAQRFVNLIPRGES
jgi:hypothetical protein